MTVTAPGGVCVIRSGDSAYRIINPGGRIGSKIVRGEPYERRLLTDIRQRHHSGTFVDVGAHVGGHSLYVAAVCGLRVVAFEANPATYEKLVANLDLNPWLDIEAHCYGLGDDGYRASVDRRMVVHRDDQGDAEVRRFDAWHQIDDLAVVKVDVEGMEADVLTGMARHLEEQGPTVYAECHTDEATAAVDAVLAPHGYAITRHIHMGSTMVRWERR